MISKRKIIEYLIHPIDSIRRMKILKRNENLLKIKEVLKWQQILI